MLYYSPTTGGFYHRGVHGDRMPEDAVAVSATRHRELMAAQASGHGIEAGKTGSPVIRRQVATLAQKRALLVAACKIEARRRIETIAPIWRQLNDMAALLCTPTLDDPAATERRAAIDAIRAASGRIEATIAALRAADIDAFDVTDDAHWTEAD